MTESPTPEDARKYSRVARAGRAEVAQFDSLTFVHQVFDIADMAVASLDPNLPSLIHQQPQEQKFVRFGTRRLFPIMKMVEDDGAEPFLGVVLAGGHIHRYNHYDEKKFSIRAWSLPTAQEPRGTLALPIVGDVGPDDEIVFVDGQAFLAKSEGELTPIYIPKLEEQYTAETVSMPRFPADDALDIAISKYQETIDDLRMMFVETFGVS